MAIPAFLVLAVVVVFIVVAVSGGGGGKGPKAGTPDYSPAASGVVSDATTVPASVYDQVGLPAGSASQPTVESKSAPLTNAGKPEVLYMGDEWCPYCGAARWSLVSALSRFGTFKNLKVAQSSSSDVYPDTNTFSFFGTTYSSPYLSFVPVELQDSSHNNLQRPTAAQTKLINTYDTQGSVPFIDIGNKYIVNSTYSPAVLQGLSWDQIAGQLNNPSSKVAQAVIGSANFLSAAVCKITNGQPGTVCDSTGVKAAAAILATAK